MVDGKIPSLGGRLLRTYRHKEELTQNELAARLDISNEYVSHLELGWEPFNNLRLALRIEIETDGAVDVESWLESPF